MSGLEKDSKDGYKTALKSTSLFGGVQVITILFTMIRTKLTAMLLGPSGFGIMSIFNSTIQLLKTFSSLGLPSSIVREIAIVDGKGDKLSIAKVTRGLLRWLYFVAFMGAVLTIIFSKQIALYTFNDIQYSASIASLSISIFFLIISEGYNGLLQGFRKHKSLVLSNITSSIFILLLAVPIFYYFAASGIIYFLNSVAFVSFILSSYFLVKEKLIFKVQISQELTETFKIGLGALKLGIMMCISTLGVYIVEIVVKSYILKNGGSESVGLYQAGWSINSAYVGVILTAIAKDYYPRVSKYADDNIIVSDTLNKQTEISLIIMAPILVGLILFVNTAINILYTSDFIQISLMVRLLLIGSFIQVGSWTISFVFLAKGDSGTYLFNELLIKCITLPSYIFFYYKYDLTGIGLAFIVNYIFYFIIVSTMLYKKHHIRLNNKYWKLFIIYFVILCSSCLTSEVDNNLIRTTITIVLLISVFALSLYQLNKRINILKLIRK